MYSFEVGVCNVFLVKVDERVKKLVYLQVEGIKDSRMYTKR